MEAKNLDNREKLGELVSMCVNYTQKKLYVNASFFFAIWVKVHVHSEGLS